MKFTTVLAAAAFSASALAAPAANTVSQMAATSQWVRSQTSHTPDQSNRLTQRSQTITNMKRTCGGGTCTWNFGIKDGSTTTPCTFQVHGSPATNTDSTGNKCSFYTVSTGWSDQFGANNGFTTLSVVNNNKKQIIYPSYTDKQLGVAGKVVKPDQSYAPANLPA